MAYVSCGCQRPVDDNDLGVTVLGDCNPWLHELEISFQDDMEWRMVLNAPHFGHVIDTYAGSSAPKSFVHGQE